MIKVTVQYNDHLVDIHFPCSENTLQSALMEIHAADDNPPELFITDVIFPEELDHLKDRFVNLDELNYLAKRMESFFGTEEEQFYEAMKQEGFTELKDLINLSFNLNKYCLIQNIGNMSKIGQEYFLNRDGSIPANDDANPKYAEIGRRLMQSGTGTECILFLTTKGKANRKTVSRYVWGFHNLPRAFLSSSNSMCISPDDALEYYKPYLRMD